VADLEVGGCAACLAAAVLEITLEGGAALLLGARTVREVLLDAFRDEPGLEVMTSGLFGTAPVFVVGSVLLSSATLSKDMKANPFFSTAVSVEAFTVIS